MTTKGAFCHVTGGSQQDMSAQESEETEKSDSKGAEEVDPKVKAKAEKAAKKAEKKALKAERRVEKLKRQALRRERRRRAWNSPLSKDGSYIYVVKFGISLAAICYSIFVIVFFYSYHN